MEHSEPFVRQSALAPLPTIRIAGDVVMKPGRTLGPRQLRDYELLYFPGGSDSVYTVEGKSYSLREPAFIVCRPGELHEYAYDLHIPTRHLFVHFHFADTQSSALLPILQPGGPSCVTVSDDHLIVSMLQQIIYVAYAHHDVLQRRGASMLLALLEELNGIVADEPISERDNRMPQQIATALELIERRLHEPITVEQLARGVGWTHEHFSRVFTHHVGRTPRETIVQRRIEKACQLLLHEDDNVKQIAYSVGFADENYFYRVFKSVKGVTPSQYRDKYFNPRYRHLHPVDRTDTPYPPNRIF